MPSCRNCGARISKFDKDICPVCGTKDPLQGITSETIEVTSQIDLDNFIEGQKAVRRKKTLLIYFLTVGFTGVPFFYLKKKNLGIIWLIVNFVILGGLFALFNFAIKLPLALAIILPIVTVYVINGILGAIYFFKTDIKDGAGEFVV